MYIDFIWKVSNYTMQDGYWNHENHAENAMFGLYSTDFIWVYYSEGPIGNKPALVQVMAWRRTDEKPLSEPMLTQFTDTYMWL